MNASPETTLPGLAVALDPAAVLEVLSEALQSTQQPPELLQARAIDVQLRPGERCLVLYRLRLRPAPGQRSRRVLLHVVALPPGAVEPHPLPLIRTASGLPAGVIGRPDIALELRPFPFDPRLPWLASAMDPAILRSRLDVAWGARRRRVVSAEATPLAYVPESRAALELRLLAEDPVGGLPEQRHLVAKMHARRSCGRLFAAHWALWRSLSDEIGLAPPVGWVASLQLALQEWVDGERLSNLFGTATASKPVRKAASALARVHRQRLPLPTVRDVAREGAAVSRWAAVVRSLSPEHARRVDAVAGFVLGEIARRWVPAGVVHGDFHPANVLVHDDQVRLLDWEQMAWGDPLSDVGRFLASLRTSGLRVGGRPDALADLGETFIETYAGRAPLDEGRVRLYEAAALVASSATPFRLQRDGWQEAVDAVLGEAERAASASVVRSVPVSHDFVGPRAEPIHPERRAGSRTPGVPFHESLEWALDPTFLLASLVPLLSASYPGSEFLTCRPEVVETGLREAILRVELRGHGPSAGILFIRLGRRHSRRGLSRLGILGEASGEDTTSLGLPRVLGAMPSLRAAVVESRATRAPSLAAPVAVDDAAADRLARAIDRLGRAPVDLGTPRTAESMIAALVRRSAHGRDRRTEAAERAGMIVERAAGAIAQRHRPGRPGVVLDGLSLSRLVDADGRPTATAVWRAQRGDPLMMAGRLVSESAIEAPADTPGSVGESPLSRALSSHLELQPAALAAAAALLVALRATHDEAASADLLSRATALLDPAG